VKAAEVQNMARHVLRIALWLSAELRAALESSMQLRRGDEVKLVNRQVEMIDPTKCRKGYASAAVSKIKDYL
jgi:23S rRNA C2498 (ribose-2'-O)-methylase RlmM